MIRSKLVNERINVVIVDDRKKRSERERIGASGEAMVEEVLTRCVVRQDGSKKRGLNGNCGASRVLELCDQIRRCHGKRRRRRWRWRWVFDLQLQQQLLWMKKLPMYLNNLYHTHTHIQINIHTYITLCMYVWYGMVGRFSMVWYGTVRYGMGMGWDDASLDKMNEHLTYSLPLNSNS